MRWGATSEGKCWPAQVIRGLGYAECSLNITTDVFFAIVIPISLLWDLNSNRRTRLTLMLVLGLGFFVCVASIIKTVYLYIVGDYNDWLWDSRFITLWSIVEINLGIIAGSVPTLRPILIWISGEGTSQRSLKKTLGPPISILTIGRKGRNAFRPPFSVGRSILTTEVDESSSERAFYFAAETQQRCAELEVESYEMAVGQNPKGEV